MMVSDGLVSKIPETAPAPAIYPKKKKERIKCLKSIKLTPPSEFMLSGVRRHSPCLYFSVSSSASQLQTHRRHGNRLHFPQPPAPSAGGGGCWESYFIPLYFPGP